MPVLSNAKHERFAQEIAQGKSASEAYVLAGYSRNDSNSARLNGNERIRSRVEEILSEAAKGAGITVERVLAEYAKIAFSDLRKAVKWKGSLIREEDNPDGGDILVVKEIVTNHVQVVDSDDLDDDTAAAIAEVKQTRDGLTIKLHSKTAALDALGKHLGMFKERVEHTGPGGGPIETRQTFDLSKLTDEQLAAYRTLHAAVGGDREGD